MQNGICEAFNGRMRDELLNETIFYDLDHARSTLARWTAAYNQKRPHSALGYLTPAEFAETFTATGDRLRNPDQLRRSPIAPPALLRQSQPANSGPNWMNVGGHSTSSMTSIRAPGWPTSSPSCPTIPLIARRDDALGLESSPSRGPRHNRRRRIAGPAVTVTVAPTRTPGGSRRRTLVALRSGIQARSDGHGTVLFCKRLERGRFVGPSTADGTLTTTVTGPRRTSAHI